MDRVPFLFKLFIMNEANRKKLIDELGEAMMCVNSAECAFISKSEPNTPTDEKFARELSKIWGSLYSIRKFYKEGLGSKPNQSKGEPEKTA